MIIIFVKKNPSRVYNGGRAGQGWPTWAKKTPCFKEGKPRTSSFLHAVSCDFGGNGLWLSSCRQTTSHACEYSLGNAMQDLASHEWSCLLLGTTVLSVVLTEVASCYSLLCYAGEVLQTFRNTLTCQVALAQLTSVLEGMISCSR